MSLNTYMWAQGGVVGRGDHTGWDRMLIRGSFYVLHLVRASPSKVENRVDCFTH